MPSEIELLERSLEYAEMRKALGDKMLKLANNKDFQEIIEIGYYRDEASRLTGLLGDPDFKDQGAISNDLQAIAAFQRYCRKLTREGEMAEKEIIDCKSAIEEIRTDSGVADYE